jgi:hypothetical protein
MSEKKQYIYPKGIIAKRSPEKVEQWMLAKLSVNRKELIEWLQNEKGEWINLIISKSDKAKFGANCYVDDWKPSSDYKTSEKKDKQFDKDFDQRMADDEVDYSNVETVMDYGDVNADDIPF